ncbi:MAG: hypothetical protein GX556_01515 [Fibrobacter sp.]|nr:hypothetical protein [Fibrobacter sp.]
MRYSVAISILAVISMSHGAIDFYGYRATSSHNDTTLRYSQVLLGYSDLDRSEISIVPRGTYLDVTEDAWISSDVTRMNVADMTGDYLFRGSIPVPREAVVTGLHTWKGDTLYRAGLYETRYVYDASFPDSIKLQQSLDSRIALLQQHTNTSYELTLCRVSLGEKKHIRIRYLLRSNGVALNTYVIPVLLHSVYGKNPDYMKVTVFADNKNRQCKLQYGQSNMVLSDTSQNTIPFQPFLSLQLNISSKSAINLTEFTNRPYRGNYLSVNTSVTDSLISRLSKPVSTVFIWRWNMSSLNQLVYYNNGIKELSSEALSFIGQARLLKNTMVNLRKLGNPCGLIHVIEGQNGTAYSSKAISLAEDSSIMKYLDSVNEEEIYKKYSGTTPESDPLWIPDEGNSSSFEQSRNDLISALQKASSLLKKAGSGKLRHILLVSAGGIHYGSQKDMSEELGTILDGITVGAASAQWHGVNIGSTFPASNLYLWNGFLFPSFSPAVVRLRIKSAEQNYDFQLSQNIWSTPLKFTGRVSASWDTVFYLTGFDEAGKQTSTIEIKPIVYSFHADSALAKLWAGDKNHIAETEEEYPGGTFGILTKATFFQATKNSIVESSSRNVAFLSDEEIFAPKTPVKNRATQSVKPFVLYRNGVLQISSADKYQTLKIYDLNGKLLLSLELSRFRTSGSTLTIPLAKMLGNRGKGKLVLVFTGKRAGSFTLLCGGAI